MSGTPENPSNNPERVVVDRIKAVIQSTKVLDMDDSNGDRVSAANEVLKAADISGVDDLQDLLNKRSDKNVNQDGLGRKVDLLGMAIGESILENGSEKMKSAVIAGSFSTEEILPSAWRIRVEGLEGDDSLSRVIVDGVVKSGVSSKEKQESVTRIMETVDFYKNNPQYGDLLPGQLDSGIEELNKLITPLNKREMVAISEKLKYLVNLKNGISRERVQSSDLDKAVEKMTQAAEKTTKAVEGMSGSEKESVMEMVKSIINMRRTIGSGVDELPEDYVPGGIDPITGETREAAYYSRMDITAEMLAVSMQLMDPNGARFDAYRPTEWYKQLPKEQRDVIDVMMEVSMAASSTYYYGKDVDKILGSKVNFSFTSEKMRTLFDDNFKLVMSKMLNDLTEEYTDQNLHKSLRYKEGFYRIPVKSKDKETDDGDLIWSKNEKKWVLKDGLKIDDNGFLLDSYGKRKPIPETYYNIRNEIGKMGIVAEVMNKLRMIENYKGELAFFLADKMGDDGFMKYNRNDKEGYKTGDFMLDNEGKKIPKPICKMYANTAWNLWYGMGDSSLADRMRVLPTWNKIISDGIRTMNPEGKLYSKLQIWKGGVEKKDSALNEAEYFTGEMGQYILEVMGMESDLGEKPLKKGDKTMRRKILDGDVHILPDKTLYGFFDFVNGGRDLVQTGDNERPFYGDYAGDNTKKTLGQFLLDYAYTGDKNNRQFIEDKNKRNDFNFKKDQVSFMNEFADSWQAAILINGYLMGKADAKDPNSWARAVKSSNGMMNGIKFNGDRFFKYVNSPETWRAMIVACFKADHSRLSSDYIPIVRPPKKDKNDFEKPYSFFIEKILVKEFGLSSSDVDLVRLAQLLGVDIKRGQDLGGDRVKNQTNILEGTDIGTTTRYINQLRRSGIKNSRKEESNSIGQKSNLLSSFDGYERKYGETSDFAILRASFKRAINSGKLGEAESVLEAIKERYSP